MSGLSTGAARPVDRPRPELAAPWAGVLHLVVGPSGVGKDTLIDAARDARPDVLFVRRVITRDAEAGGEVFDAVDRAGFEAREAAGSFALSWRAHGLCYGLPIEIEEALARGQHVIANGSRRALPAARARFPKRRVLHVDAPPSALAQRLAARGRESAAEVEARLLRGKGGVTAGEDVVIVDNGGALRDGIAAFLAALAPPHETRRAPDPQPADPEPKA